MLAERVAALRYRTQSDLASKPLDSENTPGQGAGKPLICIGDNALLPTSGLGQGPSSFAQFEAHRPPAFVLPSSTVCRNTAFPPVPRATIQPICDSTAMITQPVCDSIAADRRRLPSISLARAESLGLRAAFTVAGRQNREAALDPERSSKHTATVLTNPHFSGFFLLAGHWPERAMCSRR